MRLVLALGLASVLGIAGLVQAEETGSPLFVPPAFLPGQIVEAKIVLATSSAAPFAVEAGRGLPAIGSSVGIGDDPEIRSASLSQTGSGWLYRITFVPWSPGPSAIPILGLGGGTLPPIPFVTASTLAAGDRDLSPPKSQRDPPGTAFYLYASLGILVLAILLLATLILWVLPGARALLAHWREREAFVALSRSLTWLEKNPGGDESGPFFSLLARSLRLYLAARIVSEAEALTPSEFLGLPASRFPLPAIRDEAAALLGDSDAARWSGRPFSTPARIDAARRARRLGEAVEEALLARV